MIYDVDAPLSFPIINTPCLKVQNNISNLKRFGRHPYNKHRVLVDIQNTCGSMPSLPSAFNGERNCRQCGLSAESAANFTAWRMPSAQQNFIIDLALTHTPWDNTFLFERKQKIHVTESPHPVEKETFPFAPLLLRIIRYESSEEDGVWTDIELKGLNVLEMIREGMKSGRLANFWESCLKDGNTAGLGRV